MSYRTILVVAALLLVGIAGFTIPVVPIALPSDKWKESEFAAVKDRVSLVSGKLHGLHYKMSETVGQDIVPTYNLIADYGTVDMRRPLFGSWRYGTSHFGTWAFGTPCLLGMPFVEYDHAKETARLTPGNFDGFMAWAAHAEIDLKTRSYKTSDDDQLPNQ